MHTFKKRALAAAVAVVATQAVSAGTAPFFVPLTKPEIVEPADSIDERNAPWSVPYGVSFTNLTSMEEIEDDVSQSIVRVPAGNVSSMFDMLAYDPTGEYIFIPHETPFGAGVSRYDVENDVTDVLFKGDETGNEGFVADTDFGAFDPVRWTPNGTLIAGEEWAGTGRLVEICDPYMAAPTNPVAGGGELVEGDCANDSSADYRVLNNVPLTAQEGISFGIDNPNIMYYVDEDRSGSIYKTVYQNAGDLNGPAQTFVLQVNDFLATGGDVAGRIDRSPNNGLDANGDPLPGGAPVRSGPATWVPITDANGGPLEGVQDPTVNLLDDNGEVIDAGQAGRDAADAVDGTPFCRPEDTTITKLKNGNEVLYFAATCETSVIGIEETANGPFVRYFATAETPKNVGFETTTANLNSPDNLAIDALGNIYIIEDSPNTTTVGADGGDIWFARDVNNDGVAESIDHFMSLQVNQSEATGMIFHPVDPTKFVVAVQHPASTGLGDTDFDGIRDVDEDGNQVAGFGDAIWQFDLTNVQPPACVKDLKQKTKFNKKAVVNTCVNQKSFNFIKFLNKSEQPFDFPTP